MSRLTTTAVITRLLLLAALVVAVANGQQQPACAAPFAVNTNTATTSAGSLVTPAITAACGIPLFTYASSSSVSGQLQVNLKGDYVYTPPAGVSQLLDVAYVDVSCLGSTGGAAYLCKLTVAVTVSQPLSPPPGQAPPSTPTPAPDVPSCPNVYYYVSPLGLVMSGTLRNQIGQMQCDLGRAFRLNRQATLGNTMLVLNGDFTYTAPSQEAWDDFGFDMYCFQTLTCRGTAYVLISAQATLAPAPVSPNGPTSPAPTVPGQVPPVAPSTTPAPSYIPTAFQTCRGTCADNAWKAVANLPGVWDTTADENGGFSHILPRKDAKQIGSFDVSWDTNALVINFYSTIGNVADRFPTLESFGWAAGDGFTSSELLSKVASSSLPFDPSCLDNQPAWGMAEEVWRWISIANKTGTVGRRYASGATWYHKFGGKHVGCDAIQQSCKFAPLLTPRAVQDANQGGAWSVAINDCDVTWTGRFGFQSLLSTKTKSGDNVFRMRDGNVLEATVYSVGVKPTSWLEPSKGYMTDIRSQKLTIQLTPLVSIAQDPLSVNQFSTDLRYYGYLADGTGDVAFGLNLLIFPLFQGASAYAPDRHVTGFRWISQSWTRPNAFECPSCTGVSMQCVVPSTLGDGSFLSSNFPQGNCTNPRIVLTPGPRMSPGICLTNRMHIVNRPGFSMPRDCSPTFQNLTIRAVAPGSGQPGNVSVDSIAFEGSLRLQMLLDNGQKPTIDIGVSRYVATSTIDSPLKARVTACRGSPYWPVLDPLGSSLADAPHPLASNVPLTNVLCMDPLNRMFGSQGWALVMFDIVDYKTSNIVVEALYATYAPYPGRIFFINNDPVLGSTLPDALSSWWWDTHPFFNFRDITNTRLSNGSISFADGIPRFDQGYDLAYMLTPGAVGIPAAVAITCVARVVAPSPDGGATPGATIGRITMTQMFRTDPALRSQRTNVVATTAFVVKSSEASLLAVGVIGGIMVLVVFVAIGASMSDGAKELPKWVPRVNKVLKVFGGKKKPKVVAAVAAPTGPKVRKSALGESV